MSAGRLVGLTAYQVQLLRHLAEELEERPARFLEGQGAEGEDATPEDFGAEGYDDLAEQQEELRRLLHQVADDLEEAEG